MRWRLVAGAMTAVLVVGTCASPSADDVSNPAADEAPQRLDRAASAIDPDATAPAKPIPRAREGGTLTVYSSDVPRTFDPTAAYYTDAVAILTLVTRGLTQYKYDPKTEQMVLVPDMATDLGRPNEDFTRWTFTLRDGLKLEDGREVTSAHVAHAIRRQFAAEQVPGGPSYGVDYFAGGATYQGPYRDGDDFAGVETRDEDTIVIKMRRPFADLRHYASFPAFTAIPEEADTGADYADHPLATGPYKFADYEPGERLVLEPNPHWDPKTDTTRHQYIDRFVFRFGADERAAQRRVVADRGADQRAIATDGVLAETFAQVRGTGDEHRIFKGRGRCTDMAFLDTRRVPLEVRRAIQVAWPIAAEMRAAGQVPGLTWSPATSIMPSITPGWADFDVVGNRGEGDGDPQTARRMLEEAGQAGFELAFPYAVNDPTGVDVAKVRRDALAEAGFDAEMVPVPNDQLREYTEDPDAPIDIRFFGWCTDWPSGGAVFPALFDGRKIMPSSVASNPSLLDADEVNSEIDRISALPPEEGLAAWGELDRMVMERHAPVVVRGEVDVAMLHGSKVGNPVVDEARGMPHYVSLFLRP